MAARRENCSADYELNKLVHSLSFSTTKESTQCSLSFSKITEIEYLIYQPGSISSSMIEDASLTRRIALSISLRSLSDDLEAGLTMAFFEWLTL